MATGYNEEHGQSDLQGYEDLDELTCQPCHNRGRLEKAIGMCTDCQEYLCQRCYDAHTIPTPFQNHELLGKEQMLQSQRSLTRKDACFEKCDIHDDEVLKYYCINHCQLGCSVCITLDHRLCNKVSYIPKVAKDLANNEEYKQTEAQLNSVFAKSKMVNKTAQNQTKSLQDDCFEAIKTIQGLRREINITLDNLEKDLIENAKSLKCEEMQAVDKLTLKLKNAHSNLQSTIETLERLKKNDQNCSMYIVMMKTKNKLTSLENEIQTAEREQSLISNKIQFVQDREILNTLRNPRAFGIVRKSNTEAELSEADTMTLRHTGNRHVQSKADNRDCWITGSVSLSDNRLLVTDYNNEALKMIDVRETEITRLSLSTNPQDITMIDNNQVAVTLPYEKTIAIVSVTASTMSIDRTLSVRGRCYGVSYRDGKLAVSLCIDNKVQILDLQGTVSHTITTDKNGSAIFNGPYYVTFGRDNTTLYVSNTGYNNVVCVKCDGTVVATYTDAKLKRPRGLAVDKMGNVYVCAVDSNQILQITPGDATIKAVLAETGGLIEPYSISYNETNHTFSVGVWNNTHSSNDTNTAKLYKAIFG